MPCSWAIGATFPALGERGGWPSSGSISDCRVTVTQRLGNAGQTLEFHARLPDGGLVISFADVSARVDAETALERANHPRGNGVEERTGDPAPGSTPDSRAPARKPTPPTATRPGSSPPPATTCCSR